MAKMEWFDGNVNDALNNYQQKQGILVVYVYAENDQNSNKFDELWNSFDIKTIINQTSYIAIRLLKDSEGAQQFAQFFPTLTIPVCYILGLNAQPLEVITALQELSLNQLNASFAKALSLYNEQLKEYGISKSNEIEEEKMTETMAPDSTSTDPNAETADEVESEATKGMSKEEKLAYYRKLIEDKKKADVKKDEEEERRKEIQRRNEGKAMAEIRDKLRDKELKESAEARRKQKEDDAAVLKRLREQLKADKEERAKRNKGEVSGEPKEAEKAATSEAINKPINTDECRIQCKFPDGSTLNLSLPSKEPLQVVYDAVTMDSRKPENFFFVQPYPRKKLTEMNKSLLAHGLTPSSVILVIANENPRARNYALVGTGYLNMLLGFIYVPFIAIYQFFMSFTNRSSSNNKKQPKKANKEAEAKTGKTLKDGNFQRLNNDESDHSDNEATWNGNSTQQL